MDKPISITRRAAILGLAAGSAIAATVGLTISASAAPVTTSVAIARHKAVMRTINRMLRQFDKLETLPGRPGTPRVQVGNLVHWNREGEQERTPIIAYDHKSISEHCESHIGPALLNEKQRDVIRARYAGLHRDLTRQIRARARFDRLSGLTALEATLKAAYRDEAEAEAVLLLARPATAQEATAKAAYIKRSDLLMEWTECPVAYRAVMRGLCEVREA
jgi:hypothetical protein